MARFNGISHLDLTVTDADRSAAWYADVLGLRQLRRADLGERIMIVMHHRDSGLIVGLLQHREPVGDRFTEFHPGLDHVGFAVSDRDDLVAWERVLTEKGVEHSPITDSPSGSGTALVFRDPDNIQLEFWWSAR